MGLFYTWKSITPTPGRYGESAPGTQKYRRHLGIWKDATADSQHKTAYAVTHIFSTPNDKKKYTDLLFIEENMTIDGLPEEIKNMLDENLLHK